MTKVSTLIRQMAKEGHKLASLEKASVLSASDDPKDQDKAREIRVRHDYESLKKQIGSKKKPSKPAVEESMGGGVPLTPQELEIQKKMSKLNVRLARKRSQQMQKAKIDDTETSPEQVKEGVTAKYKGKNYKLLPAKVRAKMSGKGGLDGDYRDDVGKAKDWVTDKIGLTNTKRDGVKEEVLDEKKGRGKRDQAELDRAQAYLKKHPNFGRERGKKDQAELDRAQAYIKKNPNFGKVSEAKVDQGRSDYGKASIRNYRRKGPGHGEPAMFDPENKRGKLIDKRREEHKARRGVKGAKVPAYKVSEGEDRAFNLVRDKLKAKYGDGVLTTGEKPKPPTAKQKAEYAAHKKKIAQQDPRDPTEKASDGRYSDRHSNRGSD